MNRTVQCPSCGAPIELAHRNVKVVKCEACDSVSAIDKDGVDPLGKSATLTDFFSALTVGAVAAVRADAFKQWVVCASSMPTVTGMNGTYYTMTVQMRGWSKMRAS